MRKGSGLRRGAACPRDTRFCSRTGPRTVCRATAAVFPCFSGIGTGRLYKLRWTSWVGSTDSIEGNESMSPAPSDASSIHSTPPTETGEGRSTYAWSLLAHSTPLSSPQTPPCSTVTAIISRLAKGHNCSAARVAISDTTSSRQPGDDIGARPTSQHFFAAVNTTRRTERDVEQSTSSISASSTSPKAPPGPSRRSKPITL